MMVDNNTPLREVGASANGSEEDSAPDLPAPPDFPDGGWQAWLVVLGSWCITLPSFGLMNTIGVFTDWLATYQMRGHSKSTISWIFSVYVFFLMFGSVQVGPLFDAYGLRYILIMGSVGLVVAMMVFSVSQEYYQFMLGFGVLGGISASMLFTPSVASINQWFFHRRALVTAIVATAGSIGGIIFPLIFEKLARSVGFPWAIRTLGFICLACCTTGALLQKTRLPPNKTGTKTFDFRALREIPFSLITVAIILADTGATIPLTYLTSYMRASNQENNHGNDALSYQLMSILNAASILGRLMPGYAADRYGRFNTMIITTAVSAVLTLGLWLKGGGNQAATISYAALFGFWSGSAISLCPVCVAQISKTEDFGKRYGATYTFVAVGVLVAIPIAGQILDAQSSAEHEDYSGLILFCGLIYLGSFVFFILARGVCTGWKLKQVF